MASGIVIHVSAGDERRSEFFTSEQVKLGTDSKCDLQIEPPDDHALNDEHGVWLELHRENGFYRIADFRESLHFQLNDKPLSNRAKLQDGDSIVIPNAELSFSFFNVNNQSALTQNRSSRSMRFIEEAAIESAASPKRDDAKVFLREFVRELVKEVGWTTKLVMLLIALAALAGVFYLGYASYVNNRELAETRAVTQQQGDLITQLRDELARSRGELSKINESQQRLIDVAGLGPKVRNEYGSGVCLLVGTYDLVDKQTGKQLRYPDPAAIGTPDTIEPAQPSPPQVSENGFAPTAQIEGGQSPLTTEGFGTPVEFDFVGTGFHVGRGYIVTNRHVVQPWKEDERVKVMTQMSNGRARLRRLVVYFPGFPQPFPLKVRETSTGEDLAVAQLDPDSVFPSIPVLPLDNNSEATTVGKPVVTIGYPSGPDRILAMVDEAEARSIQSRYTNLQSLVNYLAQKNKINPLLTQGAITDLDPKRIVHDAKTGEGGSGAPLFGASGKVIGVNFGVFTENAAANMAVPIRYALPMLQRSGWQAPDSPSSAQDTEKSRNDNSNTNANANSAATRNR